MTLFSAPNALIAVSPVSVAEASENTGLRAVKIWTVKYWTHMAYFLAFHFQIRKVWLEKPFGFFTTLYLINYMTTLLNIFLTEIKQLLVQNGSSNKMK